MTMIPLLFLAMAAAEPAAATDAPSAEIEKLLQDCDAHKFETVVNTIVDGKPHQSKVKLCGTKGQSNAAWADTLKDAIAKIRANDKLAPEVRRQIAAAMDAELAKFGHPDALALVSESAPSIKPPPKPALPPAKLGIPVRPPAGDATRTVASDYGGLPPLPAPKPEAQPGAVTAFAPSLPPPRMTIQCGTTDDPNYFTACRSLRVNSLLMIEAGEQLPAGTSLRFMRRGDDRGSVQLAQLRNGQTTRIPLPQKVCNGVVHSEIEIEVLRKAAGGKTGEQVVDSLGPYDLRC
jgi:hypothetical protein